MTAPDAVLHIGMPRSGAGTLQRALSRLRPQLRAHGVAYLGHQRLTELAHVRGWEGTLGTDPRQAAAFERELAEAADAERARAAAVRGDGSGVVLLSSDHLVGGSNLGPDDAELFRPKAVPAVAQTIRALGAGRVRVVLYTRRQDRLMELCYLREVENGRHHRFEEQFRYRFQPVLDYASLIERLGELAEVAEVVVRPFELTQADPVAYVGDFLDLLGVVGLRDRLRLDVVGSDLAPHRVYSRRGLQLALAMSPHLDTGDERRLVRGFVLENFAAGPDDRAACFLPKRVRQRILDAYQEPNRRLFHTYLPDLPDDSYADHETTERLRAALALPVTPARPAGPVPPAQPMLTGGLKGTLNDWAKEPVKEIAGRLTVRNRLLYRMRLRYFARRCDVFLVSFPKCGRTWLRVMLGRALGEHFGIRAGNPMRFTTAGVRRPGVPRILATHDDSPQMKPAHRVIRDKRGYRNRRVILLVRDPHDVVVSLYFHVTRRRRQPYQGDLSDFVRDPVGSLASLLAFYDAWTADPAGDVLLVRYEDMHADPGNQLRRVLDFIGVSEVSDATVAAAVDRASFERLQREERAGTASTRALRTHTADDPESYKVRRGKVGGYQDYLHATDIDYVAAAVAGSRGARDLGYA